MSALLVFVMAGALEYFRFVDKQPIKAVQIMTARVSEGKPEVTPVKPLREKTGIAGWVTCTGFIASSFLNYQIPFPIYTKLSYTCLLSISVFCMKTVLESLGATCTLD